MELFLTWPPLGLVRVSRSECLDKSVLIGVCLCFFSWYMTFFDEVVYVYRIRKWLMGGSPHVSSLWTPTLLTRLRRWRETLTLEEGWCYSNKASASVQMPSSLKNYYMYQSFSQQLKCPYLVEHVVC